MCSSTRVAGIVRCWALIALATPALTAEPASPGVRPEAGQPPGSSVADARVTLDREAITLEELMSALGNATGIKLVSAKDVRWDQVTLRVRDRPAERVLAELAELLNYTWVREERQRTLHQDVRSRAYEEEQRRRWYGGAIDELLDYAALARRSPAYYARLEEALKGKEPSDRRLRDPLVQFILTDPGRHAALRLLLTLSREQFLALVSAGEREFYLPWRQMTSFQRELALQVADEMAAPAPAPSGARLRAVPQARRWVQEMGLLLHAWLFPGTLHPHIYQVFLCDAVREGGFWITPPEALTKPSAGVRGSPYPPPETRRDGAASRPPGYQDLEQMPFPARDFRQTYPSTWPRVFQQLAERLPFALYSDSFAAAPVGVDPSLYANATEGPENPPVLPLERMSLAEGLDALCARYRKVWWREGDALFFRSRTWFLDRLYQVPPPVLAALQQQLRTRGKLDQQGIRLLTTLTGTQLSGIGLLVREQMKRWVPWVGLEHRAYWPLRVYAVLSEEQKAQVLGGAGLAFSQMTAAQQRAYREALFLCHAPAKVLEAPPPFLFEQELQPGVPDRQPSLAELTFFLPEEAGRPQVPRRNRARVATLYIPFPAEKQHAEGAQPSR